MEIGDPVPVDPVYQSYVQYCQRIGCKPAPMETWAKPKHYAVPRVESEPQRREARVLRAVDRARLIAAL